MSAIPILFTIPNFITAGSGRVMLNIIQRLDRSRFAPTIAVLKKGGKLDDEVNELGIPLIEAPFEISPKPYATLFARSRRAAEVFRPYHFTLWHSFHYSDSYTEALIAYFSGAKAWIFTKKSMAWGSRAWLLKSYLASRVVADNTDMLKGMLNRAGLRNKVSYIPHGVDTQKFKPGLPPRLGLREKLAIPSEKIVTCVAELIPVKGHSTLLQALTCVPGAHLLLAGRPMDIDYVHSLRQQASDLKITDRVHFLGGVDDVPTLLAESDLFILPTQAKGRMEGCPVALLEAMSCGRPCIATDIPGSHDLIVHGQSGLIVPPEEPSALADAIQLVLGNTDLGLKLGRSARKRVEEHYTIEREVKDHVRLYNEILGNPAA